MIKRMVLMLLAMTLIVGGVVGFKLYVRRMTAAGMAAQRPPPAAVAATQARAIDWQSTLRSVGSFSATQGLVVSAQLDAAITKIAFEPGSHVEAGALLVQQDISTELGQLKSAEAAAALARLNLTRATQLNASGSAAQSEFDAAEAAYQQACGQAEAIKSIIEKKTIRAPFAGYVGVRHVSLGQFLRSGAAIVSLQALDPIFFNFTLPQQHAARVRPGQRVSIAVDAFPEASFAGVVSAVNPDVDEATRALQIQASLRNPDRRLQPGMFGTVELELPIAGNVVTVPVAAIVANPYGDAVYVVETAKDGAGSVARQQFVTVGEKRGDRAAILKGVKPGDTVVTAGQLKLRSGAMVAIDNAIVPEDSPAPRIEEP